MHFSKAPLPSEGQGGITQGETRERMRRGHAEAAGVGAVSCGGISSRGASEGCGGQIVAAGSDWQGKRGAGGWLVGLSRSHLTDRPVPR